MRLKHNIFLINKKTIVIFYDNYEVGSGPIIFKIVNEYKLSVYLKPVAQSQVIAEAQHIKRDDKKVNDNTYDPSLDTNMILAANFSIPGRCNLFETQLLVSELTCK